MTFKKEYILLFLILAIGSGLRLSGLGKEGFWLDEGVSISKSTGELAPIFSGQVADPSPPLYYLLLSLWTRLFGTSEVSARIPSAIFGIFSIFMIYRLGVIFFDNKTGELAAFLLAVSPFHLYFSQEARMYSLLVLLTMLSMYYFQAILRSQRFFLCWAYLFSTILLTYTHNFGISAVLAQNIFLFSNRRRHKIFGVLSLRKWLSLQAIILAVFTPWLLVIFRQFLLIQKHYWTGPVSLNSIWITLLDFSGGGIARIIFILLMGGAFLKVRADRKVGSPRVSQDGTPEFNGLYLSLNWFLIPIFFPFIVSLVSAPVYISRITIAALPACYLLVARGAFAARGKVIPLAAVSSLLILSPIQLNNYLQVTHKQPFREIVDYVSARAEAGDLVFINPPWYKRLLFDHYNQRKDLTVRSYLLPHGLITNSNVAQISALIGKYERAWVILCHNNRDPSLLKTALSARYRLADQKIFPFYNFQANSSASLSVYHWRRKEKAP